MTHDEVVDILMTSIAVKASGESRETVAKKLRARFPTEVELTEFWNAVEKASAGVVAIHYPTLGVVVTKEGVINLDKGKPN